MAKCIDSRIPGSRDHLLCPGGSGGWWLQHCHDNITVSVNIGAIDCCPPSILSRLPTVINHLLVMPMRCDASLSSPEVGDGEAPLQNAIYIN